MDRTLRLNAIIRFIESHIKENIEYRNIEKSIALSYRQIREDFKHYTSKSLKQYIINRKITYAVFEIETTNKTLLNIASEYNFNSYDTFTRCFKREMGMTPKEYRKGGYRKVKRGLIGMGTYAPIIHKEQMSNSTQFIRRESNPAELNSVTFNNEECILFGVPKVEFANGKCTPLPACLESVLAYIGQRDMCTYTWLMAASGLGFRFCWKSGQWDMSNSNIMNISEISPWKIYEDTFRAAGWSCIILSKEKASKEEAISCIRSNIDNGKPIIALGVIGPPEACIITGYKNAGNQLLGWNYFQDSPEFRGNIEIEDSGYFLSSGWWDNQGTIAFIVLEEKIEEITVREALENIHKILTGCTISQYQTGQNAYNSWKKDILEDEFFRKDDITPILLTKFFCQADAETVIGEGRYWGAQFFRELGDFVEAETNNWFLELNNKMNRKNETKNINKEKEISKLCLETADLLKATAEYAQQMTAVRKGEDQTEEAIQLFCKPEIRVKIALLIEKARISEKKAAEIIDRLISLLTLLVD